jgi:hypothetical protein
VSLCALTLKKSFGELNDIICMETARSMGWFKWISSDDLYGRVALRWFASWEFIKRYL